MAIQKKEVEFSKELDDAMILLIELIKDIKDGKNLAQLSSENLPNLMEAISNADEILEETKSGTVTAQTVGYRLGELVAALTKLS